MVRFSSISRVPRLSPFAGSAAIFSQAIARAAASSPAPAVHHPLPPVMTPLQANAGAANFQQAPVVNATTMPGYGVYSPEYLASQPAVPAHFPQESPPSDPVDHQASDTEVADDLIDEIEAGKPLDLIVDEQEEVNDRQELFDRLEAAGMEVETESDDGNGSSTTRVIDPETDTTVVEYASTERENGVVVEETTAAGRETVTTVADEEGSRTQLAPEQETTREGIDGIAQAISEGKGLETIAEELGVEPDQLDAQLRAAGFELSETQMADGTSRSIVESGGGEEIASYHVSDMAWTSRSLYVDADGRETRTTTSMREGGANRYEVESGDSLIAIAESHGVTLDELEENNPELFDSASQPGVIHAGDTVIIESATQTTVEATDNGYTLTTSPNGGMKLRRDEDGQEVDIEPGTTDESLAELLMELDGESDEVLEGILDNILLGGEDLADIEALEEELAGLEEETRSAIDDLVGEGGDEREVIKPATDATAAAPGTPPSEEAPSGGGWELVRRDGEWVWVDAALVETIAAEEGGRRERDVAVVSVSQRQAELGIHALDPEYEEAREAAVERLNEVGETHGVYWELSTPEGSLEDMQMQLENASAWSDYLESEGEYLELQADAESIKQELLEEAERDGSLEEELFQEEGFEQVVDRRRHGSGFTDITEPTGELLDQSVVEMDGQLYLRNVYAGRDEPLYRQLTQDPSEDPGDLSEARQRLNREWHELKHGEEPMRLQDDALEAFREANPEYFDPDGYSETTRGAMGHESEWESGELTGTRVVERDGQLYVINTYGEGYDQTTKEFPLTYASGEAPDDLTQAQRDTGQAWQEFTSDRQVDEGLEERILADQRESNPRYFDPDGFIKTQTSPAGTQEDDTGALQDQEVVERDGQLYLINTYENLDEPLEIPLTFDPDNDGGYPARTETQRQHDSDWASWKEYRYSGEGSLVEVGREYHDAQVALIEVGREQLVRNHEGLEETVIPDLQEAADEAAEEHGEGSVVPGDEEVERIEIDGEMLWVHPEVAAANRELIEARETWQAGLDITGRARELYGEQYPRHLDPAGFREPVPGTGGRQTQSTGALNGEGEFFVGEDGQLWLRHRYENREEPERFQLTYAPGEAPEYRTEDERQLDQEWADWWAEQPHSSDRESPLTEAKRVADVAAEDLESTRETYGHGTTELLTDTLPDDVEPVLATTPEGEQRWVHPDVAQAWDDQIVAETQLSGIEVEMEETALSLEEADYRSARPSTWKLLDDVATFEHEQGVMGEWGVEDVYLDANGSEGTLTQARRNMHEQHGIFLASQLGLAEAGLPFGATGPGATTADGAEPEASVSAADLREALAEHDELGDSLERSVRENDMLRAAPLDERLDPEQRGELEARYFEEHPEVDNDVIKERRENLPERFSLVDEEAERTVGEALGTDESALVDPVVDQLRELGGDAAEVDVVPILYRESREGVRNTALFRVRDEQGREWLVDESGSKYRNFEDFRQNNYLSDKGHVFLPDSPDRMADANGDPTYEWRQARELSFTEEWLDPVIGIGTGAATVASFFPPLAPIAAPIAFAGGAYFGARSAHNLHEMHEYGRPLASPEGAMHGAMLVTSLLPMGSSAFRAGGLMRTGTGVPGDVAMRLSIGAVNTWGKTWRQPVYQQAAYQLTQSRFAFNTARHLDVASMGTGVPLMGYSGANMVANWDDMSGLERVEALTGLASGLFSTGMGYQALRASRTNPGASETATETLALGKPSARRSISEPPPEQSRLYRLDDLDALNRASTDGSLSPGQRVLFVTPRDGLDTSSFVLREGEVQRGGLVDRDGHIKWTTSRREGPAIFSVARGDDGRQTVSIRDSQSDRVLRTQDLDGEAYALVTDRRASQLRGVFRSDEAESFALYNGREDRWGVARGYEREVGNVLKVAGTVGAALSAGLPPDLSIPLNAVAQGVRALSLASRARSEGVELHSGLWRTMRGIEFITHAINMGDPLGNYIPVGGKEVLFQPFSLSQGQDVAFAAGLAAAASMAYREAVTGKEASPRMMDVVLPSFAVGESIGFATAEGGTLRGTFDQVASAVSVAAVARMWFRDAHLGQRIAESWGPRLPLLGSLMTKKLGKWDYATLIGFSAILGPRAALAMKDHIVGQLEEETEGPLEGVELPGYVPPGFFPAEAAASAGEPGGGGHVLPDVSSVPDSWQAMGGQRVVLSRDGLLLRASPDGDSSVVTHLPHGTFLAQAGGAVMDADGHEWLPVRVETVGEESAGWAMERELAVHATGAMGARGRINPEHEGRYAGVTVEPNQTLGAIAVRSGHDVEQVVMLNMDHIIDPNLIFPGDRVYLPAREPA